jgi:hypothetical protein
MLFIVYSQMVEMQLSVNMMNSVMYMIFNFIKSSYSLTVVLFINMQYFISLLQNFVILMFKFNKLNEVTWS